jgi:hypothetical protein
MRSTTLAASLLLALAGCATLRYQEPASGPRARVRFVTNSASVTVVSGAERPRCEGGEEEWMRLRVGSDLGSTKRRLGIPLWHYGDNAAMEVYVRTDRPLLGVISSATNRPFGASGPHLECAVAYQAELREGEDYEVGYVALADGLCLVGVSRIVGRDGGFVREPVAAATAADTQAIPACAARHPALAR